MSVAAKIQIPGNTVGSDTRLEVVKDDGTVIEIPIIQSSVIAENITGNITGTLTSTIAPRLTYLADPAEPGACTINHPSGRAAVALGATSVVITNSLVTTATICLIVPLANDATATTYKAVCTANTITVTVNAAATADWPFQFVLIQGTAP